LVSATNAFIFIFQYFLTEVKELAQSAIEKIPLSSRNYAATFRDFSMITFDDFFKLPVGLFSTVRTKLSCQSPSVSDPEPDPDPVRSVYWWLSWIWIRVLYTEPDPTTFKLTKKKSSIISQFLSNFVEIFSNLLTSLKGIPSYSKEIGNFFYTFFFVS